MSQSESELINYQEHAPFAGHALSFLLISILTLACYFNAINGDFIADDYVLIVNNPQIKSLANIPKLFTQSYWGEQFLDHGNYRPLTNLTFVLNYALGGLDPRGYHLLNIIIHLLNSSIIYLIGTKYLKDHRISLLTAIFFAVHPAHTEAVTNIAGRPELLSSFFLLLGWLFYAYRTNRREFYLASLICYFLGLLVKESAIVLVGILFISDLLSQGPDNLTNSIAWFKKRLPFYAGYMLLTLLYLMIRFSVIGKLGVNAELTFFKNGPFIARIFTMSQVFIKYYQLMIWPNVLSADYDFSAVPLTTQINSVVIISLLINIGLIISILIAFWRNRFIAFAGAFFIVTTSIISNIIFPTGILMAERVLYMPLLTICLLFAGLLINLYQQKNSLIKYLALILIVALTSMAIVRCYYRNKDWSSPDASVYALIKASPNNTKALLELATIYWRDGQFADAEREIKKAIEIAPNQAKQCGVLAQLYVAQGRFDEALPWAKRSLEIFSRNDFVYIVLAQIYNHKNQFNEAITALKQGQEISPYNATICHDLAINLALIGDRNSAIIQLTRAIELKEDYADAHANLALMLRGTVQEQEAWAHIEKAVELEPNNAVYHNILGNFLSNANRLPEAITQFNLAITCDKKFLEAYNNLGVAYIKLDRFDDARKAFEAALSIDQNYANAKRNLEKLNQLTANN